MKGLIRLLVTFVVRIGLVLEAENALWFVVVSQAKWIRITVLHYLAPVVIAT